MRVPPRRIMTHYRQEVEKQIDTMLEQRIIEESSSPWMAPAVFVPKKSGEIRMCVDYRKLNEKNNKRCLPLAAGGRGSRLPGEFYCIFHARSAKRVLATPGKQDRQGEDSFLPRTRNGSLSVLSNAIWAYGSYEFISTPHGYGPQRIAVRAHLP